MPVASTDRHPADSRRPADSYVVGPLDVTTAADLRACLLDVLDVLDGRDGLDEPSNRPSTADADLVVGVGLLVGVHRQAGRRGRRLVLTGVPPRVMRLLTATRLSKVLAVRAVVI
jgi:hypothetical protein